MNTTAAGNSAERFVAKELEAKGFIVASRRHIGGAGDLLAVRPDGLTYLVEVKRRKNVYAGFRKADREAMKKVKLPVGGARWLANVRGSGVKQRTEWTAECNWP